MPEVKSNRWVKWSLLAVGVLLLISLGLVLFSGGPTKTAAVHKEGECPDCGRQLPRSSKATGDCPFCMLKEGPAAYKERRRKAQESPISKAIPIALGGVLGILLLVHLGLLLRSRMKREGAEDIYYYHCPKCQRKLRYRERQIGQASLCPLCRRPVIFPRPLDDETGMQTRYRAVVKRLRAVFSRKSKQS